MAISKEAQEVYAQISSDTTKLGDLRKIAKDIKKNHSLAMELWATGEFYPRQLAILIMDKKLIDQEFIDLMMVDMQGHNDDERTQLVDWLMANQLTKDKKLIALMVSWENSPSILQRRIFWYYQARLRWMGKIPIDNAEILLSSIENNMLNEAPEVQWAMNFSAGQIGIFESKYRNRCIALGEKIGLYKNDDVPKGCTPNYLPEFIKIQVDKISK